MLSDDTNRRILIIDDNKAIHEDFRKLLFSERSQVPGKRADLDALEQELFGESVSMQDPLAGLEMDSAYQGLDGVQMVAEAQAQDSPYLLTFVDMRMPPGIDGLETIQKIWEVDPRLNVVICSAYSDYTWREMLSKLQYSDQLLILKKPFDYAEVLQIVKSMTEKWFLARAADLKEEELTALVLERTSELERISKHKTQFLSAMSHELRTPLNGIMGFTELLANQFYGPLNEKQSHFTEQTQACANHLLSMVNDILDFVKAEAGELEVHSARIPVRDFLNAVTTMIESQFIAKDIELEVSVEPNLNWLFADKRKTLQVVLNLLSNAIKYTESKGRIQVRAEIVDDAFARISVEDTGVGLKPEHREKLFTEFFQAERARDESLGGTGIGLALTRNLVELQGGEIGVDSVLGEGSTFWFTVPMLSDEVDTEIPETFREDEVDVDISSTRILVAEDNEVNIMLIEAILKSFGVELEIAKNGQEALDIVGDFKPDIILMDMRMPVMGGVQATRLLKNSEAYCDIPVIALTANADVDSINECLDAGASAHVPKPIQAGFLRATIASHLRR